jgi:membrane-bound lytic murein transglycosylase A
VNVEKGPNVAVSITLREDIARSVLTCDTMLMRLIFILCFVFTFVACTRRPVKSAEEAMRPTSAVLDLKDDLQWRGLRAALVENIRLLRLKGDSTLTFGPTEILAKDYATSLEKLVDALPNESRFRQVLAAEFQAMEVYGQDRWGEIFLTSYFAPEIPGSRHARPPFITPLRTAPRDLVEIDLASFGAARPSLGVLGDGKLRGRLVDGTRVVAFPDRAGIEAGGLKDDTSILAWVDPIDAFFLQVQGSGVVKFVGGEKLALGYAAQNGYPYVPIGRFLRDKIAKEKMSQQAIEAQLRAMSAEDAAALMNRNPSYVFFRKLEGGVGESSLGGPVVDGRTIATDGSLFPKGALAFLEFSRPVFDSPTAVEPASWEPTSRFVLDQDTGGAIRGGGRVDLFWGRGAAAKQAAGVIRGPGRLVYFVPRGK